MEKSISAVEDGLPMALLPEMETNLSINECSVETPMTKSENFELPNGEDVILTDFSLRKTELINTNEVLQSEKIEKNDKSSEFLKSQTDLNSLNTSVIEEKNINNDNNITQITTTEQSQLSQQIKNKITPTTVISTERSSKRRRVQEPSAPIIRRSRAKANSNPKNGSHAVIDKFEDSLSSTETKRILSLLEKRVRESSSSVYTTGSITDDGKQLLCWTIGGRCFVRSFPSTTNNKKVNSELLVKRQCQKLLEKKLDFIQEFFNYAILWNRYFLERDVNLEFQNSLNELQNQDTVHAEGGPSPSEIYVPESPFLIQAITNEAKQVNGVELEDETSMPPLCLLSIGVPGVAYAPALNKWVVECITRPGYITFPCDLYGGYHCAKRVAVEYRRKEESKVINSYFNDKEDLKGISYDKSLFCWRVSWYSNIGPWEPCTVTSSASSQNPSIDQTLSAHNPQVTPSQKSVGNNMKASGDDLECGGNDKDDDEDDDEENNRCTSTTGLLTTGNVGQNTTHERVNSHYFYVPKYGWVKSKQLALEFSRLLEVCNYDDRNAQPLRYYSAFWRWLQLCYDEKQYNRLHYTNFILEKVLRRKNADLTHTTYPLITKESDILSKSDILKEYLNRSTHTRDATSFVRRASNRRRRVTQTTPSSNVQTVNKNTADPKTIVQETTIQPTAESTDDIDMSSKHAESEEVACNMGV